MLIFFRKRSNITGDVQTQTLHRGIYDAAVFRAQVKLSGKFAPPDFGRAQDRSEDVQWKDAFVDHRGERSAWDTRRDRVDWGGMKRSTSSGFANARIHHRCDRFARRRSTDHASVEFSIALDFNGSGGIFFAPFGVQNEATLKSNWPDPGFRGAFLPAERSVRPDGFDAKWKVSYYGRDYPQQWTSRGGNERLTTTTVSASLFGAQFLSILDAYRFVERSIKYGVLFLVLVFTTFFLFEVTARQKIHPFNI